MRGNIKEMLSGVYAPMTTPFRNDEILFDGIIRNVQRMNKSSLRGYFVCGTNGEFKSLSVEERLRVLEIVVKHASKDKVVMGGTAAESTKETIDITRKAADVGVQLVSLLVPSFFKKIINDDVLIDYVLEVAEASPVPVLIYNNPSVTGGILVSPEVIRRVSGHPNVVGMKDSSKGNYLDYVTVAGECFYILAGSAGFFFELLKAGGIGGVLSLANVFPDDCVALYSAFIGGRMKEAERLNDNLVSLNKQISGKYSVAGVKAAMNIAGFTGGDPRRPLKPLSETEKEALKKELIESGYMK
ncbi:4-hydroxy-tetrahydrodipicolinate synthase [subsurface metagenome]